MSLTIALAGLLAMAGAVVVGMLDDDLGFGIFCLGGLAVLGGCIAWALP